MNFFFIRNGTWPDEAIDLFESLSYAAQWVKLQIDIKTYENRQKSHSKKVRPVPGVELFDIRENTVSTLSPKKWCPESQDLVPTLSFVFDSETLKVWLLQGVTLVFIRV